MQDNLDAIENIRQSIIQVLIIHRITNFLTVKPNQL